MADTALFSVAECRAFDKAQLANETTYPDATITDKEAEIREWLARVCGVDFVRASHTEYHDGDDSDYLVLQWPMVSAITSIHVDGVALSSAEIDPTDFGEGIGIDERLGIITRRSGIFDAGWRNIVVVYTAGYEYVPKLVKRAALMIAVTEIPAMNIPFAVDDADIGGMSLSYGRGDGYNGNWHRIPDVQKAIRAYDFHLPGVA